jgi:hypothetical protein
MQSSRVRLMLVALFGVFALSALTAAAAQAVEAPRWSVAGKTLGAGETHYLTAKIYTTKENPKLIFVAAGRTLKCLAVRFNSTTPGVIVGSSAGNAGTNLAVLEFFGNCTMEGNGTKCNVEEPIVTNPVKSEGVETEGAKPAESKGSLLTLFTPVSGSTFITVHFKAETGGTCTVAETSVTGKLAAQVRKDPENGTLGELVELGQTPVEAKSWLVNFPSTPIKKVTTIRKGEVAEEAVKLTAFSEEATLTGGILILLAKKNGNLIESDGTLFSPLP